MKTIIKVFCVLLLSLASECDEPFEYSDNSRLVVEATLRYSDGGLAKNETVMLQTVRSAILAETVSDANGRIFLTTPLGNYPIVLSVAKNTILSVSRFPEKIKVYSNTNVLGDLTNSYYDFGTVQIKPIN